MPSWGIHLALANKLNKKLKLDNNFIIGNVLPDATNGISVKGISNVVAHFKTHYNFEGPNNPPINRIDAFLEDYGDKLDNPLILGSFVHLLTDNYYNRYFRENHTICMDGENRAKLNDGSIDKEVVPWKLKQEEFRKYASFLASINNIGKEVHLLDDTLKLSEDLKVKLNKQDFILILNRINSIIEDKNCETQNYRLFTQNELTQLFNECLDYLSNEFSSSGGKIKIKRR